MNIAFVSLFLFTGGYYSVIDSQSASAVISSDKVKDVNLLNIYNVDNGNYSIKSNIGQKIISFKKELHHVQIEKVFGTIENDRKEIDYSSDVKRWKRFFVKNWDQSLEYARQEKANYLKRNIASLISHLDDSEWLKDNVSGTYRPDLLKFVGSLSDKETDTIFNNFKDMQPIKNGPLKNLGKPFEKGYFELNTNQQKMISSYFSKQGKLLDLNNAVISVYSTSGVGLEMGIGSTANPYLPVSNLYIGGESWGNEKLRSFADNYFFKQMAKIKTPKGALLGAILTEQGVDQYFFGQDKKIIIGTDKPVSINEFFNIVNKQLDVDVLSDYYTTGKYILMPKGQKNIMLSEAAKKFGCVFRLEGNTLFSRTIEWPVLDNLEIDFPLAEKWICFKEKNQKLLVSDMFYMCKLEKHKIEALYDYYNGFFDFKTEIDAIIGRPDISGSEYIYSFFTKLSLMNEKKEINFNEYIGIDVDSIKRISEIISMVFNCVDKVEWLKFDFSLNKESTIMNFFGANKKYLFSIGLPFLIQVGK